MSCRLALCSAVFTVSMLFAVGGCETTRGSSVRDVAAIEGSSGAGAGASDAQQEISALVDQYTQALLDRDLAALDRIWADDLSFINLRGELLSKQNRMDNVRTGATAFKSIRVSDKQIRPYGDAAVATILVALEAQYSGHEGSGDYRVTMVWARPTGTWQMVAVQMTKITS